MGEVRIQTPRLWLEFPDPEGDQSLPSSIYRVDLTWLTSRWTCIFGRGCQGIIADRPDDGCCTLGAHFSGPEDQARIERLAGQVPADLWQFRADGLAHGLVEGSDLPRDGGVEDQDEKADESQDSDRDLGVRTRLVEGACIFLNRPGFPAGAGCALHHWAQRTGTTLVEAKPDVCWQLPLRRDYEERTTPDGREVLVTIITEYDRHAWGPGGADLAWYCSSATEAHVGTEPVYVSLREELTALIGHRANEVVAAHCRALTESTPEQADDDHCTSRPQPGGRRLLPLAVHPAG